MSLLWLLLCLSELAFHLIYPDLDAQILLDDLEWISSTIIFLNPAHRELSGELENYKQTTTTTWYPVPRDSELIGLRLNWGLNVFF